MAEDGWQRSENRLLKALYDLYGCGKGGIFEFSK
jgi:hypothetical protein